MNKPVELIQFSLNGQAAAAAPGETILQVAKRSGLSQPEAEQRVDAIYAQAKQAAAEVKARASTSSHPC